MSTPPPSNARSEPDVGATVVQPSLAMYWPWKADLRGVAQSDGLHQPTSAMMAHHPGALESDARMSSKRKAVDVSATGPVLSWDGACSKRARIEATYDAATTTPPDTPTASHGDYFPSYDPVIADPLEEAADSIQYHFGLEILLKHDELRLINQELAKCQVALEQLRRCHLIPYPVTCPTPQQMVDISNGTGIVTKTSNDEAVPRWAAPFGVTDGPYARHFAKWLIPDQAFDGLAFGCHDESIVTRPTAESRSTRTNHTERAFIGKRSGRSVAAPRLQALSTGYPVPKDKTAPCVFKRADGQLVKLVCIDCRRDNFSSTQGFINHCRIAHKRDLKSHEEAALRCGQAVSNDVQIASSTNETAQTPRSSSLIRPLAGAEVLTESQIYSSLASRIQESLQLFRMGKLQGVTSIPGAAQTRATGALTSTFVASSTTPHLSKLMRAQRSQMDLHDQVLDATMKMEFDADMDDDDAEHNSTTRSRGVASNSAHLPMPASRTPFSAARPLLGATMLRAPSKPTLQRSLQPLAPAAPRPDHQMRRHDINHEDDASRSPDFSPHAMKSNNAPSLVSDDGDYDDSDDAASSTDDMEVEGGRDMTDVEIEDSEVHLHMGHRGSTSSAQGNMESKGTDKQVSFLGTMIQKTDGHNAPHKQ